jgi:hypothetical protein
VGCLPVGEDLFKVVGSHALPVEFDRDGLAATGSTMQAERRKAIYEICARYGGFSFRSLFPV